MADYLTGLLAGFNDRKREVELQNLEEGLRSRQREASVLQTLIQSPDPETRNLAIAGLLESAAPAKRKSGLSGWIGKLEQSPFLARIQALSPTVQQPTAVPDAPTQSGYLPSPPPAAGGAAQAPTSPTVRGADGAPLSPVQPMPNVGSAGGTEVARFKTGVEAQAPLAEPPPQVGLGMDARGVGAPPPNTISTTQPRRLFPTQEDLLREQARGRAMGDVEGEVAGLVASGYPEAEARSLVQQSYLRKTGGSTTPYQAIPGEYYDPSQDRWIATYATFDKRTGRWLDSQNTPIAGTFRQTPRTAQHTMGIAYERAARAMGFANGNAVPPGPEAEAVNARAIQILQEEAYSRGQGTGQARFEAPVGPSVAAQTGLPIGSAGPQFVGQRVGTVAQQDRVRNAQNIHTQLAHIKTLLDPLPRQGTWGAVAPNLSLYLTERQDQYRPAVAQLQSAVNNIRATLTRTMQDNRGTETERDAERALSTLTTIEGSLTNAFAGDTVESASARIDETIAYLQQVASGVPGTPSPAGVGVAPPRNVPRPTPVGAATRPGGGLKPYDDGAGGIVWR